MFSVSPKISTLGSRSGARFVDLQVILLSATYTLLRIATGKRIKVKCD